MNTSHPLQQAIELVGLTSLAKALGVSYQAVGKWRDAGRLPRTEWTGETNYAETIEALTQGAVTREALMSQGYDQAVVQPAHEETRNAA